MGNSLISNLSGSSKGGQYDPSKSAILSLSLQTISEHMEKDAELRAMFAKYILSKVWMNELLDTTRRQHETMQEIPHDFLHGASCNHLMYELPSGDYFPSRSDSSPPKQAPSVHINPAPTTTISRTLSMGLSFMRTLTQQRSQFDSDEAKLLLCAALVPRFMLTGEYIAWEQKVSASGSFKLKSSARQSRKFSLSQMLRSSTDLSAVALALGHILGESTTKDAGKDCDEYCTLDISVTASTLSIQRRLGNGSARRSGKAKVAIGLPSFHGESELETEEGSTDEKEENLTYFQDALNTLTNVAAERLVEAFASPSIWLRGLLHYLDTLPMAICISDARRKRRTETSFPLIFVNQAFEKISSYTRSEVLGKNCRFLQSEERTEMQQVGHLIDALRDGRPVKVGITNVRKTGEAFLNLLAIRPVHNAQGSYTHVLGVLYDMSQPHENLLVDLEAVDTMLRLLPLILV